ASVGWNNLVSGLWHGFADPTSGLTHFPEKHPFNPFESFGWGYVLWQLVFQIAVVTTWQTQISRVLSSRDETTARRMYQRTAFYFVGRFGLPGLWGAAAAVYFAQHGWPNELQSLSSMDLSLRATPAYLGVLLPTGFIGLLLAAALAAE